MGYLHPLARFILWQAMAAEQEGDKAQATRLCRNAISRMTRLGKPPSGDYFEALAGFHEKRGEMTDALQVRELELKTIRDRGRLAYECDVLIKLCRLRSRMGLLQPADVEAARQAAAKLRKPRGIWRSCRRLWAANRRCKPPGDIAGDWGHRSTRGGRPYSARFARPFLPTSQLPSPCCRDTIFLVLPNTCRKLPAVLPRGVRMFTLSGAKQRFCDRISRRDFLAAGALGGLSLANVLRLQAANGKAASSRGTVIMVCLAGGPRTLTCTTSSRTLRRRFAANSSRSGPTCPASTSASTCRCRRRIADKLALVRTRAVCRADAARAGRGLHRLPEVGGTAVVRLGHQPLPRRRTGAAVLCQPRIQRRHVELRKPAIRGGRPSAAAHRRHRGRSQPRPGPTA